MTVDIFDIQLLNTMCHQRIFLSFRFALRESDLIYIFKKKKQALFGYFQTLFSFLVFIALIWLIYYFMN